MVFQYVSDGKKLLASALLTKGVTCAEDASFMDIYNAIISVEQELLIGVEQIPGTITYDLHHHVDGNNNLLNVEMNGTQGGCYTTPVYHRHIGSESSYGGCYTVANGHAHLSSCAKTPIYAHVCNSSCHYVEGYSIPPATSHCTIHSCCNMISQCTVYCIHSIGQCSHLICQTLR